MTTITREFKNNQEVTLRDLAEVYAQLPTDGPLPVTPETTRALAKLISELYGDALRELEKH